MGIIEIAKSQVGVHELVGNTGIPLERYGLPGEAPAPWCGRFVRWCATQAGITLPGNKWEIPQVSKMMAAFAGAGLLIDHPEAPCVVFYKERGASDKGPGRHCGIVVSVETWVFHSVEGNWSDAVCARTVPLKDPSILAFGRFPQPREAK